MSAAITAAVIVAGAAVKSGMDAKKAAQKQRKFALSEREAQIEYEKEKLEAVQKSPMAKASPMIMKFGLGVFEKAFANHGFDLPVEDMVSAMGLDKIIANNAAGKPWDWDESKEEKAQLDAANVAASVQDTRLNKLPDYGLGVGEDFTRPLWEDRNSSEAVVADESGQVPPAADNAPSYLESAQGAYASADVPEVREPMPAPEPKLSEDIAHNRKVSEGRRFVNALQGVT